MTWWACVLMTPGRIVPPWESIRRAFLGIATFLRGPAKTMRLPLINTTAFFTGLAPLPSISLPFTIAKGAREALAESVLISLEPTHEPADISATSVNRAKAATTNGPECLLGL
jgi:hypothetical protein